VTHTEKVHVIFGLLAAVTGALALWSAYHPTRWARLIWPWLTFFIGFFLFIPVEAQTRTYVEVGWWDTLMSAVPDNADYWISNWFRYLNQWHVVQHKVGGFLIMAAGVIEFRRARGRLAAPAWGWAFPVLLLGIAVAFGIHGGSTEHLPHLSEQVHHQIFGVALGLAGVALGLVNSDRLKHPGWKGLWAILVMVVGLDMAFFYRLRPEERVAPMHMTDTTSTMMDHGGH
jgi:uncharacterized membrane protein HdeD (DUF308 family)